MVSVATTISILAIIAGSLFVSGGQTEYAVNIKPPRRDTKGIYLTAYTSGNKNRRAELVALVNKTELNAIVIDLKDYSGRVFFDTKVRLARDISAAEIRIPDLQLFLQELKQNDIYSIARIVVMQDPYLAHSRPDLALKSIDGGLWRDHKGLSWVDPTNRIIWKYNLDLAKEAIAMGFDEINFDYIRFPSDGNISKIVYANLDKNNERAEKARIMADFYKYVDFEMRFQPAYSSADLFGMVLWRNDGLNIGQRLEDATPYFDYIAPMVYPSHYPPGFEGFNNPAEHPYEIVYRSLVRPDMTGKRAEMKPWLQDFDLGAQYSAEMVRAQIKATYDSGAKGWFLWNASNRYTVEAFLPE